MQAQDESEERLTDLREYLRDVAAAKSAHIHTIKTHRDDIERQQADIALQPADIERPPGDIEQQQAGIARQQKMIGRETNKLYATKLHLAQRLMAETRFPIILDMYVRPKQGVNPKATLHTDPRLPGRLCYEASCEPENPKTGEALHIYEALHEFGFPDYALKVRLVKGATDRAVVGISFIRDQVLDIVIKAMVARRMKHIAGMSEEDARQKIIGEITKAPKQQHAETHAVGNGITPRSGNLPPIHPSRFSDGENGTAPYRGRY